MQRIFWKPRRWRCVWRPGQNRDLECRGVFGGGKGLSGPALPSLPAWRAFGPGAAELQGWGPPWGVQPRTALRVTKGRLVHWEQHLARLSEGAARLGWDISWMDEIRVSAEAWVSSVGTAACRIHLHERAISIRLESLPEVISPYHLRPMEHPLGDLRKDEASAFKGLKGAWDFEVRQIVLANGADDALLLWPDGSIAETALAAVGMQKGQRMVLPPPEGRVKSIAEAWDLPLWTRSQGLRIEYSPLHLDEVSGGLLWCMNAVRGVWQAEVVQL